MRSLTTLILTLLFVPAFVAYFIADGAASYVGDTQAVLDTARDVKLRDALIDMAEQHLHRELAADPSLAGMDRTALGGIVAGVISEQWFESAVTSAHRAFIDALDDANTTAVFELGPTKRQLDASLAELEGRADKVCTRLIGAPCEPQVVAKYRRKVARALVGIPARIDLVAAMSASRVNASNTHVLARVRAFAGDLATVRVLALIGLLACFLLIAVVQLPSITRVMVSVGLSLALSAGGYFAVAAVASDSARDHVAATLVRMHSQQNSNELALDNMMLTAVTRATLAMVDGAIHQHRRLVGLCGLFGAVVAISGGILRR